MGQFVVESAHLNTDHKKYAEGWERIFGKAKESPDQSIPSPESLAPLPCETLEDQSEINLVGQSVAALLGK